MLCRPDRICSKIVREEMNHVGALRLVKADEAAGKVMELMERGGRFPDDFGSF